MKPLDRLLLLTTALLASYQVVQGIDGLNQLAIACYTVAFGVIVTAFIEARTLRHHVHLIADNRLNPGIFRLFVELHRTEHRSAIGQCNGGHFVLDRLVYELVDGTCPIEK